MTSRTIVGCILILSGVLVVALAVPRGRLAADTDKCCNPAHDAIPTAPAGSDTSCLYDMMTATCKNSIFGTCTGDAWEDAVHGVCQMQAHKNCSPSSATATVTKKKGFWKCKVGTFVGTCYCGWSAYMPAVTKDVDVPNCTGDVCP